MTKVSPTNFKPEEDIDDEGGENRPAFVPGGDEEELTVQQEGEVLKPTSDDESENNGAGKDGQGTSGKDGEGEDGGKVTPSTSEDKPFLSFKSQAEYDAFVQAHPPKPATTETPKDELSELEKLVVYKGQINPETGQWEGEKPADWNDFFRTVVKYVSDKVSPQKVIEQIKNMTAKERQEMEEIDKEFDKEYDELATQGLVPKRGTKEGDEINTQISTIGGQYGLSSMKKAHELWAKIPKEHGGGLNYQPVKKVNPSKVVSRMIGSSKGNQNPVTGKNKMSYNKLHSARGVDDLLDD